MPMSIKRPHVAANVVWTREMLRPGLSAVSMIVSEFQIGH